MWFRLPRFRSPVFIRLFGRFIHSTSPVRQYVREFDLRREKLAQEIGLYMDKIDSTLTKHLVLLPSAPVKYMAFHVPYVYHQDSNYFYLTGLVEPNSVVALEISCDPSSQDARRIRHTSSLFFEVPDEDSVRWNGPGIDFAQAFNISGVENIYPLSEFEAYIHSFMSSPNRTVWLSSPFVNQKIRRQPTNFGFLGLFLNAIEDTCFPKSNIRNPGVFMDELRCIKSASEIDMLRKAVEISSYAFTETMIASKPGVSEMHLNNVFEFETKEQGAQVGYPPVVGGGPRSNIIHYLKNDQIIKDGELVLVDAGARVNGYTADITRTWPINGGYTQAQRILYEILIEVQATCAAAASPDTSIDYLYQLMMKRIAHHLEEEKIILGHEAKQIAHEVCPHHVGHYLGLDIHDAPTVSHKSPLTTGVVFTIEPGLYFPRSKNIPVNKDFSDIGIRLEDDYVISKDGVALKLSETLPYRPEEIEKLVGKQKQI